MSLSALTSDGPSARPGRLARLRRSGAGLWLPAMTLALLTLAIFGADLVVPHDPNQQNLRLRALAPFADLRHPLGTDQLGRDLLSRSLHGGQPALAIAAISVAMAGLIGTMTGVMAAFRGGWLDQGLSHLVDMKLAIPNLLLALVVISFGGKGIGLLILVIALSEWPVFYKLARANARLLRDQPYILAARIYGASPFRIVTVHLCRAVLPVVAVGATLGLSKAVILESSLSYLGLGVQPPTADWGMMIAQGQAQLGAAWWISIVPGALLVIYVALANHIGDRIADSLSLTEPTREATV